MCPLASEEKKTLLDIARKAIAMALTERRQLEVAAPHGALAAGTGAFVTLRKGQRLRGCIGRLFAADSLANVVAQCAAGAATEDPRFSPLRADELGELEIEISVLSEVHEAQAEHVEAGTHGLVISRNGHRGVLLPQVAREHHWPRERFLEETCRKAGLNPDAWKESGTQIEIFTTEMFSESDFPGTRSEEAGAVGK
ncbi:MAG TPA: AmmeMemoRadiSam system protein A [Candidatus Acidoferrales bacterium]|nr:AmmeMemoRadiSam system protein A [Candidatus Acidoferrales bacterium]